jgi:hypothetical protein
MYNAMRKVISQHEKLTSRLCDIYNKWYTKIAYNGKQPAEMMKIQAAMLQEIFTEIYGFIEPIIKDDDELKAPNNEKES